jgi:hypothetical protein
VLKSRVYIQIILLLFSVSLMAQKPLVRSFNSFNNFNASHIYDIEQDEDGFIWVASESGIFKFDGLIFRNISKENGLSNLKFTNLFLAENGTLWATQIDARTWRIDHDRLILQKTSKKWPTASMIPMKSSFQMILDTLTFVTYGRDLYSFAHDTLVQYKRISVDQVLFNFVKQVHPKWQKKIGLYLQINKEKLFQPQKIRLGLLSQYSNDSSLLLNIGNLQLYNNKKAIKYRYNTNIIHATLAVNDYLLISKQEGGILLYKNNSIQDTLLKGIIATSLFADKNNGIWIGTQNDGLLYMPSLDVVVYSPSNNNNMANITDILLFNNQIIALEEHNKISQLDKTNKRLLPKLVLPSKTKKIIKPNRNTLIAFGDYNIIFIEVFKNNFSIRKSITFNTPIYHTALFNDQLLIASINGIISYSLIHDKIIDTILSNERINHLEVWNNKAYAGNNNGLWEISSNSDLLKISDNSISHLNSFKKNLFVYYKNNNIEILSSNSNKIINLRYPIDVNHISKIDSTIFISTKNGVKVLDNNYNYTTSFEFINRTIKNNKILKTYVINNTIYLLNNNGLYSFPLKTLDKYKPYPIQIQTNNQSSFENNALTVKIDKDLKHLHFILSTFNFENNIPSKLYYRINSEKIASPIQNSELNIAQISTGISLIEISDNKSFNKNHNYLSITLKKTGYWYQKIFSQIIFYSF